LSHWVHTGDAVVLSSSNDPDLAVYALKQANGHLSLLVINKSATADLTGQFQLAGFTPQAAATLWQYGKAQDNAQAGSADGSSGLAFSQPSLNLTGRTGFSFIFPSYSMS